MTPRHRWLPLIIQSIYGTIAGIFLFFTLGGAFEIVLSWIGITNATPYDKVIAPFLIALVPLCAIAWARCELKRQRSDYWIATNRCSECGYKLRGIRDSSNRCPECGKLFKGGRVENETTPGQSGGTP
jgi:hypothetical protein